MQNIKISKQFLDLMDKVTKVTKAKQTLFFRDGDTCRMTIATKSMFVHLAGGPNDFHFDGDVVNSSSISEFVKYAKFINYPDKKVRPSSSTPSFLWPGIHMNTSSSSRATSC